jgi:16S rRNA (cytosine1402-N4)-methyltransferase
MIKGRGEDSHLAASGPALHIPVLRAEVRAALDPRPGGLYLDGTFGAGGYTRAILETPGTRVLALDRDRTAIAGGAGLVAEAAGRLTLTEAVFSRMAEEAETLGFAGADGAATFDGVALDIGVSSMQFDQAQRGFSFRFDGPLDMRMGGQGPTAGDLVNGADEERLADIFFYYGEERASRRIARAIAHDRKSAPFTSTKQLAEMIARVNPARPTEIHPATRVFQALRIAVNDELGELARALVAAERILKPGGRLVVVSFHSLEDRIVKQFFAARSGRGRARTRLLPGEPAAPEPTFDTPHGQPVTPGKDELAVNARARSAKLRYGLRNAAPARGPDDALRRLTELPEHKTRRS